MCSVNNNVAKEDEMCPIIYLQGQHYNIELLWVNNMLNEIDSF